ncbi:MAG: type I-B CRISPR-associated protein Cas7/Csh2, partial [Candidatus Methanomethylicaceae archaeon]
MGIEMGMVEGIPNSEILLIYEAKMCNPNGDPDAENRPRIDPKTNINLVSDVRLKRFFRDYLVENFGEDHVYVTKISGESVRADKRVETLLGTIDENKVHEVLNRCIDARLFGATVPIGRGERERGASKSFIGPVQFTWGLSLHKVELVDSSAITSVFSGREATESYGTMGRDWRLYYSLIGFYGVVSGRRAKGTGMTLADLKIFDNLVWKALQVQPTTRSKIGEMPHLYLRVEYRDAEIVLGDLRKFVSVKPRKEAIRDFADL